MTLPGHFVSDLPELLAAQGVSTYREFLRTPALSLGLFAAPIGHADTQSPHDEDEVYVVVAGEAVLDVDGDRTHMSTGSVAYVPAHVPHRFLDISRDLRVMVAFVPPHTSAT